MVRCMIDIYYHLAEPGGEPLASPRCPLSPTSHTGQFSDYSPSSVSESSVFANQKLQEDHVVGCEATSDPYEAMGKLPWADIGPYRNCVEVSWLSIRREQLQYVAHALGNFRQVLYSLIQACLWTPAQKGCIGYVRQIMEFMALAERISSNCQICLQNLRIYYSMWCTQVLVSWLMHGYQLLHKQDRGFVRKIMEFMAHAERISCNWMWFYTIS